MQTKKQWKPKEISLSVFKKQRKKCLQYKRDNLIAKRRNLFKFLLKNKNKTKKAKHKKKGVNRKKIRTTMQRRVEALTVVEMVEHSNGGWVGIMVLRLHGCTVMVIGEKMKVDYGLTQLWDWNENVIDFCRRCCCRNSVMVMRSKTWWENNSHHNLTYILYIIKIQSNHYLKIENYTKN